MLKTSTIAAAAALLVFCAGALVHPYGRVKDASGGALFAATPIDAETTALFERSCQNCHSMRTVWPWYSYLPPASWLVERDVSHARQRMNLSRWDEYTTAQRQAFLATVGAAVRNQQMPPKRFTLMHREALLSPDERERIYNWTRGERRRLLDATHTTSAH